MVTFAPDTQLTANVNEWGGYYIRRIQAVMDGTWTSGDTWDGIAEGALKMAPYRNMPDDVKTLAENTVADISSGKNKIFVGPLTDQSGAVKLPGGQVMDDKGLASLQWLTQGIEGKLT